MILILVWNVKIILFFRIKPIWSVSVVVLIFSMTTKPLIYISIQAMYCTQFNIVKKQ